MGTATTKVLCCIVSTFLCLSIVAAAAHIHIHVKVTDNPADELVAEINDNRTESKLSALYSNPGLACIALQYLKAYAGDCSAVAHSKKPSDSLFAQTFAPNCAVLPSSLSPITGRFIACQSHYANPDKAFSQILVKGKDSLDLLHSTNHTQVGAAVSGSDGAGPYFWCVLFSGGNNNNNNSSFVFQGGSPKITRPGCFSGANDQCSDACDFSLPMPRSMLLLLSIVFLGFI